MSIKQLVSQKLDKKMENVFQLVEEQDKIIQALKRCVLKPMEQDLEGLKAMQKLREERRSESDRV